MAGIGTDTLPAAKLLYVPLLASRGTAGALALKPAHPERLLIPEQLRLLEALAQQAALALEVDRLSEESRRHEMQIEAERLRSSLLSSVSHDLRTPLAAITGAASSLLEEGGGLTESNRRELLKTIYEEAERLSLHVNNLLQVTRLEAGAMTLRKELQPLEEVVGAALGRLERQLEGREVRIDLPADLPMVPVDAVMMEQVFSTSLENAVRYTPPGSPSGDRRPGRGARRHREHSGPRPRPCARTKGSASSRSSTAAASAARRAGLGWASPSARASSRRTAGGSGPTTGREGGAVFSFTIPLEGEAGLTRPPAAVESQVRPGEGRAMPEAKVLVIDDEASILRFLRNALGGQPYSLVEAATGREGLIKAASHSPDLVLLDLGLPDMDGLEVLKELRAWSSVPVIILSARGQEQDKIRGLDAGADDYLTKPFAVGELLARMRACLRRAALGDRDAGEPVFQSGRPARRPRQPPGLRRRPAR